MVRQVLSLVQKTRVKVPLTVNNNGAATLGNWGSSSQKGNTMAENKDVMPQDADETGNEGGEDTRKNVEEGQESKDTEKVNEGTQGQQATA